MAYHVDERIQLERPGRVGVGAEQCHVDEDRRHQATEERVARPLLGAQALRLDESVGVAGLAVADPDAMDHAVALERVRVRPERGELRVRSVAEVCAVEVGGNATDNDEIGRRDFGVDRRESARQERFGRHVDRFGGGGRGVGHGWLLRARVRVWSAAGDVVGAHDGRSAERRPSGCRRG